MTPLPLNSIRVLEFTHAIFGPSCGLVLADLGAEVIKVERAPDGDDTRRLKGFGTGYFTFFNRNKKSLAVDIKSVEGQEIIYKLIPQVDVVIENFAPGTMERLGYDYETLRNLNDKLIYCSLKGFSEGPYQNRVALDEVVQMMSGLAYMTGPVGQPLRAGASVVDIMGGTYGALGILVALRERDRTGKGQLVQSGLFENAAFIMGQHMAYAAIAKTPVPPMPARVSAWSIYRTFKTLEGELVFVGVTSDKHWAKFCQTFGRSDLLNDGTLATNSDRITHRDRLLPDLESMFAQLPKDRIIALCDQAEIPFAPISHPEDLFDDPHLNTNGSLLETRLPDGTLSKLPRLPISVGELNFDLELQPPQVGEHTRELLHEFGYGVEEIEDLLNKKVISEK